MKRQQKAYFFALTTVLLWSTVASAFKLSLRYLSPAELLFYAALFSVLVLFILMAGQQKLSMLLNAGRKEWQAGLIFGLLNPFFYYLVLFKAYDILPAQQAQPLNYTWAITLSLLSVPFLGHKLRRHDLIAIGVSYCGVYVICTEGNILSFSFENPYGVALALASTILWSLYWIMNTRDKRDPVLGLLLNFLCSIPLIGIYLITTERLRLIPWQGLAGAAYVGCFEMGLAFVLWLMALKHTSSAARIANLIFLSPFLSLILIHFIVGEKILPSSLIGLLFIIGGLLIQAKRNRNKSGTKENK